MRIRIIPILLLLVLSGASISAQQEEKNLEFKSGRSVPVEQKIEWDVISVKVRREKLIIYYEYVGKAHPILGNVLGKIRQKDPRLYRQLRAIRTSYSLRQQDRAFYIRGMRNVMIDDQDKPGYFECDILLLELNTKTGKSYIPIISSLKRIPDPKP